jgi:hypothetical protein
MIFHNKPPCGEGLLAPPPTPFLIVYPWLLIKYICSYRPIAGCSPSIRYLRTWRAVVRKGRN